MSVASTLRDFVLPTNPLFGGDSYLNTQGPMLFDTKPDASGNIKRITGIYSYFEARTGGIYPNITVAGIQDMVKNFNKTLRISRKDANEYFRFLARMHRISGALGAPKPLWYTSIVADIKAIVEHKNGWIPVRVYALTDGEVIKEGTPIYAVENTDPRFAHWVNIIESQLQQAIWYPTVCASNALALNTMVYEALKKTTSPEMAKIWRNFAIHGFDYRGNTSNVSAIIATMAYSFILHGSDTMIGNMAAAMNYMPPFDQDENDEEGWSDEKGFADIPMPLGSIAASAHAEMIQAGPEGEIPLLWRILENYPIGPLAVVNDGHGSEAHIRAITTGALFAAIRARFNADPTGMSRWTTRLDSCWPGMTVLETIVATLAIFEVNLKEYITINEKGCKTFPFFRILWGDGLNMALLKEILDWLVANNWDVSLFVWGIGSKLVNGRRDDIRGAAKPCWYQTEITDAEGLITFDESGRCKTTPGKISKKGKWGVYRLTVGAQITNTLTGEIIEGTGQIISAPEGTLQILGDPLPNMLQRVWEDGIPYLKEQTLEEIRGRIETWRMEQGDI